MKIKDKFVTYFKSLIGYGEVDREEANDLYLSIKNDQVESLKKWERLDLEREECDDGSHDQTSFSLHHSMETLLQEEEILLRDAMEEYAEEGGIEPFSRLIVDNDKFLIKWVGTYVDWDNMIVDREDSWDNHILVLPKHRL